MLNWFFSSSLLLAATLALRALFHRRLDPRWTYALWLPAALRLLCPVALFRRPAIPLNWVSGAGWPAAGLQGTAGGSFPWLTALWLLGVLVTAAVLLFSNLHFARRLRRIRQPVDLTQRPPVYQAALPSPCLFGLLRPAIYCTPHLGELAPYVLAHERAHYRQGDHLWCLVRCLCLALHWFNPLVWFAARFSREDGELSCDARALDQLDPEQRLAYGRALLAFGSASAGRQPSLPFRGAKPLLSRRLQTIAHRPVVLRSAGLAAACLMAVAGLLAFTAPSPTARSPQEALDALDRSIHVTQDALTFTIPQGLEPTDWQITIAGRRVETDGFSHSVHIAHGEKPRGWLPGTYSIPLDSGYTDLLFQAVLQTEEGPLVLERTLL